MDGPIASSCAPGGTFCRTHLPASRPPGTPPVPARNFPVGAGLTTAHVGTARLMSVMAVAPATSARSTHRRADEGRGMATVDRRDSARPASTAMTGATGSRYWYPLTGQREERQRHRRPTHQQ